MPRSFRISLAVFAVMLVIYSALRLGFFIANGAFFSELPDSDILLAFVRGLRFDIAGLLLLNSPLLFLYTLPGRPARWKWFRLMLFILFILFNVIGIGLNIADYALYPMVQRRLMFEPIVMLPDLLRMAPGTLAEYPGLTLLFLALTALLTWSMRLFFKRLERSLPLNSGWIRETSAFALLLALTVIGIRGGLQLKPIRQSNAFVSSSPALGYLALNSTYTVLRSLFQPMLPDYELMPEDEALGVIRSLLGQDGERFTDSAYAFLRERRCGDPERKLNVVVIIMESWSGSYCGAVGVTRTVTPVFDSLASKGLLFTDFLASGQRSIEAAPSILASLPGLYTVSLIGSQAETNHYRGLGSVLRENGYATSFHHGAATGSMGFDAFARIAGFERYFGKEDFRNPADSLFDHVWGLNDEPFFLDAVERISEMPKPSCSVLYTLSSHVPFEIPRHRKRLFEAYTDDDEFERSMRYSDFALGQFFRAAEQRPWFDSTVFVITGDHTMFGARNSAFATFNVPLLILAPGLGPGRDTRIGSHVDILPTLLDLLRLKAAHSSMGRSLLDEKRTPFAVLRAGPEFMIFADSLLLIHDLEHPKGLFAFRTDEKSTEDLRARLPLEAIRLEKMLFAYVQTVTRAIAKDRVWKN